MEDKFAAFYNTNVKRYRYDNIENIHIDKRVKTFETFVSASNWCEQQNINLQNQSILKSGCNLSR